MQVLSFSGSATGSSSVALDRTLLFCAFVSPFAELGARGAHNAFKSAVEKCCIKTEVMVIL